MYLEQINDPRDLKKLTLPELNILAQEVREAILKRTSLIGGHKASNLGMVELSIALHYVYDSPSDKLIYDVSHQAYTHKILTGRKESFLEEDKFNLVTGFTNPLESEHDHFVLGHTSTSLSLSLGLAKARDLRNEPHKIVAVIGDASLAGGMALEALDELSLYQGQMLIIVNDNEYSISKSTGGIANNLKELRENKGEGHNLFKVFNLEYHYLEEGHDIAKIIAKLKEIKANPKPTVLHLHTLKGKGYLMAEKDPESYHSGGAFDLVSGKLKEEVKPKTYLRESLLKFLNLNNSLLINAGTSYSLNLEKDELAYYEAKGQFLDVGVAEESALAIASGASKGGIKVVFATLAPFFKRAYDQIDHDVCLNQTSPIFLLLNAGVYGYNSNTHLCLTDIQFLAHIPNLTYLAPSDTEEYEKMFEYALNHQGGPLAIRLTANLSSSKRPCLEDYSKKKARVMTKGQKVAIIAVGFLVNLALAVAKHFDNQVTVINPSFLTSLDEVLLNDLKKDHDLVITLEDGEVDFGYGSLISAFYGLSEMKVLNLGLTKEYHSEFNPSELLAEAGISYDNLVSLIKPYYE